MNDRNEHAASHGRGFVLEREAWVPRAREDVFAFFADPQNLEELTPPWLRFRIVAAPSGGLETGATIRYRLRVHGIPLGWTSLISRWDPPLAFVDEQVRGPYRRWVHTHAFEERDGGTLVADRVEYDVPGGRLVHGLFVRRDLERIFDYRAERLAEALGVAAATRG